MERLSKALAWLAAMAIILGLIFSYLYATLTFNQLSQGFAIGGADNVVEAFFNVLKSQLIFIALSASNVLDGGAIILAMSLAWVNRHRAWLIALIAITLLTFIWPSFFMTWQNTHPPISGGSATLGVETYNFVSMAVSFVPAVLALIYALIHRQPISAATADAELGIVRSAL